jgi:hypothetical protein
MKISRLGKAMQNHSYQETYLKTQDFVTVEQFYNSIEIDYTNAFQRALDYCAIYKKAIKLLPNKTYYISSIKLPSFAYIEGSGVTSVIKSIDDNPIEGDDNNPIEGEGNPIGAGIISFTQTSTQKVTLRNFSIDGNRDNQKITGRDYTQKPIHALYLDNTDGYYGDPWYQDPYHTIEGLFIYHCKGSGLYVPNVSNQKFQASYINHLIIRNSDGSGIYLGKGSDHHILSCNVAGCKQYGYYINGGNNNITSCKSFYNTIGLYIGESGIGTKVAGYESQEEYSKGIVLKDCNNVIMKSITSDSSGFHETLNEQEQTVIVHDNGIGVELDGCQNCKVEVQITNRDILAGRITTGVNFLNNARGNEVVANCNMLTLAKQTTPILQPVSSIPVSNKVIIDGVTYTSQGVYVEDSLIPNVPSVASKYVTVGTDITVAGWSATRQTGTIASFSFDITEKCQEIEITANTDVTKSAYINMFVPCKAGDTLDFWALCKAIGNVKYKVMINWYKGTARTYINNEYGTVSGTTMSSLGYDKSYISVTAPSSGDEANPTSAAQLMITCLPNAIGDIGSLFIKAFGLQHSAYPRKEDFFRTYAGVPSGNILPLSEREEMYDITNQDWYKANGLLATNWLLLN